MQQATFLKLLEEILEIEGNKLTLETDLKSLEAFDSLAIMSLIALTDEHFGVSLSQTDIQNISTVHSLMKCIGDEHFVE